MTPICEILIDRLQEQALSLYSELRDEAFHNADPSKRALLTGSALVNGYIENLRNAKSRQNVDDTLKAINAFTGVSKGLAEQGWLQTSSKANKIAWEVTKSAIEAAACIRKSDAKI